MTDATVEAAKALIAHLATFAGVASDRISWPEDGFFRNGDWTGTEPDDGLWVETRFDAIEPQFNEVGFQSPHRHQGYLQMTAVTRRGAGAFAGVLDLAKQLAAHFPPGSRHVSNGVTATISRKPGPEGPFTDDGRVRCVVKARFIAIA